LKSTGMQDVMQQRASSLQPADPSRLLPLLGATLRHYRQQQGWSQRELAARAGLSATYMTEIEQGHRNLSVLNLVRIVAVLGLSMASLLALLESHPASFPP
jgi:transcriptional regulator with XRE-family HTH domain